MKSVAESVGPFEKYSRFGYIMFSANDWSKSSEENLKAAEKLEKEIKSRGYEYTEKTGKFKYVDPKAGEAASATAKAFTVFAFRDGKYGYLEQIFEFGKELCAKFHKDFFLCVKPYTEPTYYKADGSRLYPPKKPAPGSYFYTLGGQKIMRK